MPSEWLAAVPVARYLRSEMGKGLRKLRIAIPVSVAWTALAVYAGATGGSPFDFVAATALVTSPAVGWTWHWVMEKPS
jgi:hypothetical protein